MRRLAPALAVALTSCRGVQTMLDPAGRQAADIDVVWRVMLVVCAIMYLLVLGFLAWALWRARGRAGDAIPVTGETPAEPGLHRGLTGWAALIVAGLIGLTTVSFLVDRSLAQVGPSPIRIKVTANQWWWNVEYRGDGPSQNVVTANELHLPLGRPAVIELASNDVIHSFWVPNLAGKVDLIPGRTNYIAVTPQRTGAFRGQCAEFCGFQHAKMAFDVVVEPQSDWKGWMARQATSAPPPSGSDAVLGQALFEQKACVMCHRIQGTEAGATVGPDLTHLMSRAHIGAGTRPNTRGDLQAWIADPGGVKPGTKMPKVALSSSELNAIVSYLETLT